MPKPQNLILYSRPDCHLCDVAADLLSRMGLQWRSKNIEGDEQLVRRYGIRIPVLENAATGETLFWPFDAEKVSTILDGV